jgi:hypothetical protein
MASMNQKSSVAQTPKSVRWVLMSDKAMHCVALAFTFQPPPLLAQ